jgi:BlaR1 peptidase M56/Surface antigen variable number repeat
MERAFIEYVVRATLLVLGIAAVLHFMRVKSAAAKHRVWTGVVILMLVLPPWIVWGPKLLLPLLPPVAHVSTENSIFRIGAFQPVVRKSSWLSPWQLSFLGVYLSGMLLLLFRLAVGAVRAQKLIRNAVHQGDVHTNSLCAVPLTVGFFHPVVILPENWRAWPRARLDAIWTHESEHARRHDSFIQCLALLNRALFWFHPAAWWLERTLSALAEEACDDAVLAQGHNPREYAECLLDLARLVTRAGGRLHVAGMGMPGSFLPQRIRQIMEGHPAPRLSPVRMACVAVVCAMTYTAFAAVTLEHANGGRTSPERAANLPNTESADHPAAKFVLGDLTIEGGVHTPDALKEEILKQFARQDFEDAKELVEAVEQGVRADFQKRGYFKVLVHDPVSRAVSARDGDQRIDVVVSVSEGSQYRLRNLTVQKAPPDQALSIPAATLREQFHLRTNDLFNVAEVRAGLERVTHLYASHGYLEAHPDPQTDVDEASHQIDLILRVSEGPHKL